ncbi:MAG: hypothetical protein ABEH77_04425 [Halobacteriaceae archaeon]
MPSLAEAYDRKTGPVSQRRLYLGTGLFASGALLVVGGILAAATPLLAGAGFTVWEAREIAGVLAGLGVPAVSLGVVTVLPADTRQRAAATVGAGVAVLGVALFRVAYPYQWYTPDRVPTTLTLAVVGIYFLGIITALWYLFTALATFKRRNDPGGTVTLEFTTGGRTRTVEVAAGDARKAKEALSGVGIFGGVDDPDLGGSTAGATPSPGPSASPTDGGREEGDIRSPMDRGAERLTDGTAADRYCGNCTHFDYVRTDEGIQPYCGYHDEEMDDMEPCREWEQTSPEALR